MFAVSYKWLIEILKNKIPFGDILKAFDTQGFEVKSVDDVEDDHIITIEVKANRPDMLSHFGVARELASFFEIELNEPTFDLEIGDYDENKFKIDLDKNICDCYNSICIDGIDNNVETPEYIKKRLQLFGMESINPVVDISNYVTLEFGQPSHVYDRDKLSGNCLNICRNEKKEKFLDLSGKTLDLNPEDIVIKDSSKNVCVAGIIGSMDSETEFGTKNIVIESAVFDKIQVRMSAKRLKISTLASFRFERGVDSENSYNVLLLIAKRILDLCGGKIVHKFVYKSDVKTANKINLRVNRTNDVLGTSIDIDKISDCLKKYKFNCEILDSNNIEVKIPSFRLDIEKEIDLIEEVARSFGYDNISEKNLNNALVYRPNALYESFDVVRNMMIGFGFNEVINYSFVPESLCEIVEADKEKCVFLQNPLSNFYNLMRPTLLYSLLYSLTYNYSIGNFNLSLFEIGRIYNFDKNSETLSRENDRLGFIFSGDRIESGFGLVKPIKYDFYDLISYIKNLFVKFNQEFEFDLRKVSFMQNSYDIVSNGKIIGFLGEVVKSKFNKILPNIKLVKDKVFYCEIDLEKIQISKKVLKFESKFPSVVRQYNLICPKNLCSKDILEFIKSYDKSINEVLIKDVYEDSNMDNNEHSLLFEIKYRLADRTMSSDEIENIERGMLDEIFKKFKSRVK